MLKAGFAQDLGRHVIEMEMFETERPIARGDTNQGLIKIGQLTTKSRYPLLHAAQYQSSKTSMSYILHIILIVFGHFIEHLQVNIKWESIEASTAFSLCECHESRYSKYLHFCTIL